MPRSDTLRRMHDWYTSRARTAWLRLRSRLWPRRLTGDAPVCVSLTTHGKRLALVHICIESIGAGSVRPRRLVLWLNGSAQTHPPGEELARLQRRGLEILYAPNHGPHTKYFPYVRQFADDGLALVTADDDGMYHRHWLRDLLAAHVAAPQTIHCGWAKAVGLGPDGQLLPYAQWRTVADTKASARHFALGVSGVIYPPAFQRALRDAGDAFAACCPRADDVWLHAMALRHGFPVAQLFPHRSHPDEIAQTQDIALSLTNALPTGNDAQIRATYTPADLQALARA